MDTILVVAAHPDDEVLGAGGVIARHAAGGATVRALILGEGATSRSGAGAAAVENLRAAARAAARTLGAQEPAFGSLPDNRFDSVDLLDIVRLVEQQVAALRPSVVYTHHGSDLNVDHSLTHRAVAIACRPLPGAPVRQVFTFETLSSTEWGSPELAEPFRPVHYVDIGAQLGRKLEALKCYEAEMRPFPHARSLAAVEHLARLRGAQAGLPAAEAFSVLRSLVR